MLGLSLKLREEYTDLSNFKWSPEKSRRHWLLFKHCQNVLFPKFLPNVPLLTDEAKFYWHLYTAKSNNNPSFQKDVNKALSLTLLKVLTRKTSRLNRLVLSDQLIDLDKFDSFARKSFVRGIINVARDQSGLEIVFVEGFRLTKRELHDVLSAAVGSRKRTRYLYLWRACRKNEYVVASTNEEEMCFPRYRALADLTIHRHHWLRAVRNFTQLETLSLNYSYVATETGDVLVQTAKELKKRWRCLQLLCLEDEMPGSVNAKGETVAVTIPDCAWTEARKYSPSLKVQLVMLGIPEYEQHKRFLTQSVPLQALVLSTGLDLVQRRQCALDCSFRLVCLWYHRTLVHLHLNLCNHRDNLDNWLRKLLPGLPNLETVEFLGTVREAVTILTMCCQVRLGVFAVKKVSMQLQRPDRLLKAAEAIDWYASVDCLLAGFRSDFAASGVTFEVNAYPL